MVQDRLRDPTAVLEMFFGCGPQDVATDVIYTPIPAFYAELARQAPAAAEYQGWWRLATVDDGHRRYSVVQHFEGNRVFDVLYALAGRAAHVAFLGLVGGLDDTVDIGEVVRIEAAVRAGERAERCVGPAAEADQPVTALTVDGLLEAPDVLIKAATAHGAQVVDLETHHFYRAARRMGVAASAAWGLVTDKPISRPFWQVPVDDQALRLAARPLLASIHDWLDSRAGETD